MRDGRPTYYSQTSCVANSGSEFSVSNPLHATLNDGHYICQLPVSFAVRVKLPLMPSALVSSVLKGILIVDGPKKRFRVCCMGENCTGLFNRADI